MSLQLKNILVESIVDDLDLSMTDKVVIKLFHEIKDDVFYYGSNQYDMTVGQVILKASSMLNIKDYEYLYSVYEFYKKYGETIFQNIPKEIERKTIPFNYTSEGVLSPILLTYFEDNYKNKIIYENKNGGYRLDVGSGDLDTAILEEMYSIEVESTESPFRVIYFNIMPNVGSGGEEGKNGYDYISHNDGLSEFNAKYITFNRTKYDESIDSGYYKIEPPRDLSDSSLKKYFDNIIEVIVSDIIIPNEDIITEFKKII